MFDLESELDIGLRRNGQDIEDGRHRPGRDEYTGQARSGLSGRTRNMKSLYKRDNQSLALHRKIRSYGDQRMDKSCRF